MDTRHLEVFVDLCETLHFGRTGERLHMSPSAISRTLARMEQETGRRLLERDNRSVRLTEAGRQFLRYARSALMHWHSFNTLGVNDAQQLKGELSVFCSVTAVYGVLSRVLGEFRHRYPGIEIKLHTGDQADAVARVLSGREDISITARPDKLSSRLEFQLLTRSPLLFIAPASPCAVQSQLAQARREARSLPLAQLPFICSERGVARTLLDQWFRRQGIKPDIYAQVGGNEAIVSMVGLGFGVGVVPELVLSMSPLQDKIQVLEVQPPLPAFAIGLCAFAQRLQDPLINAFWDCARASYRDEI